MAQRDANGHDGVREQYDEIESRFEEGMARMALYHRHCQDPVIFQTGTPREVAARSGLRERLLYSALSQ